VTNGVIRISQIQLGTAPKTWSNRPCQVELGEELAYLPASVNAELSVSLKVAWDVAGTSAHLHSRFHHGLLFNLTLNLSSPRSFRTVLIAFVAAVSLCASHLVVSTDVT